MDASTLCPFPLGASIGRGGQADVYASVDPASGAALAVKVLHFGRRAGALMREYQILRELDHPAFAVAYGAGRLADGRAWLAMERFEGQSGLDWARGLGPVGTAHRTARVLARMVAVAEAVAYLHALGVVHGDLKPGNLLIAPDGTPRIIDLGGAHLDLGAGRAGRGLFQTVAYAAPEQLDKQALAPSADVFSLAATAVRMASDLYPFGSGTREAVRVRQSAAPDEAVARAGAMSAAARAWLLRALSEDPGARPADARVFAEGLRAALGTEATGDVWGVGGPAGAALGRLRARLDDAPGRASIALVGPPGVGRARVLGQLAEAARTAEMAVVAGLGNDAGALRAGLDALCEAAGAGRPVVVIVDRAEWLHHIEIEPIEARIVTLLERGQRVAVVAATHEAALPSVGRWMERAELVTLGAGDASAVDVAVDEDGPWAPSDEGLRVVLVATALVVAAPGGRAELATLASGLGWAPAATRRALDRLARAGWVQRDAYGAWTLEARELTRALALDLGEPGAIKALAGRLADEWEGDPTTPGRAHCLALAGRHAAAAEAATRWVRGALRGALRGTLRGGARAGASVLAGEAVPATAIGQALDRLGAAGLDAGLAPGSVRTSWLLLRAEVAALVDAMDARIDAWLGELHARGPESRERVRAAELAAVVAGRRGEPSRTHRPLALAQRELEADRFDVALALAQGEVLGAQESGELALAAEGAFLAGQALAGLGRLEEAARALADAAAWWPEGVGSGVVVLERTQVLGALGRWGEAEALLARSRREVQTRLDLAALDIAAAARATDRGHAQQALVLLERLAGVPGARAHPQLRVAWTLERLRAATTMGREDEALAAAHAAEPLVATLVAAGRRGLAARLGAWQAAALWTGSHEATAAALAAAAVAALEGGHRLWWADAATMHAWLARSQGDATAGQAAGQPAAGQAAAVGDWAEQAGAWPLAMRAALADGDVVRAWDMATRFLAHADELSLTAIELAPWAARARELAARSGEPGSEAGAAEAPATGAAEAPATGAVEGPATGAVDGARTGAT